MSSLSGSVLGIGIDLISIERMGAAIARRPSMAQRLFTENEHTLLTKGTSEGARLQSLAARFAAKEAVMKALGVGLWQVDFVDIEIVGGRGGAPTVALHGRAAHVAAERGITHVLLSLSHDGDSAIAMAVATGSSGVPS